MLAQGCLQVPRRSSLGNALSRQCHGGTSSLPCRFLIPMAFKAEWWAAASWRRRQGICLCPGPAPLRRRAGVPPSRWLHRRRLQRPLRAACPVPSPWSAFPSAPLATWSPRSSLTWSASGCRGSSWSRTSLVHCGVWVVHRLHCLSPE